MRIDQTRRLTLRKETLKELSGRELDMAAGGAVQSLIATRCNCTGYYPSLNAPCTEVSGNTCAL